LPDEERNPGSGWNQGKEQGFLAVEIFLLGGGEPVGGGADAGEEFRGDPSAATDGAEKGAGFFEQIPLHRGDLEVPPEVGGGDP
jgi:hypothetical protein